MRLSVWKEVKLSTPCSDNSVWTKIIGFARVWHLWNLRIFLSGTGAEQGEEGLMKSGKALMDIRERYHRYVDEYCLYGGRGYSVLDHRCRQLFGHMGELEGRSILEIGGGEGLFSLWALVHGVERVILLEPEADGSTIGVGERLIKHRQALGMIHRCD